MNKLTQLLNTALLVASPFFTTQANANEYDILSDAVYQSDLAAFDSYLQSNDDYLAAYAHYKLAVTYLVQGNTDKSLAMAMISEAMLKRLVAAEPENAEAWSLLSLVSGYQIGLDYSLSTSLGPTSDHAANRAITLAPKNPRCLLVKGIVAFNKPEQFGGDKTAAVEYLSAAIERFTATDESEINWGLLDAYVWRAKAFKALNQRQKAATDLASAAAMAPDSGWVKSELAKL